MYSPHNDELGSRTVPFEPESYLEILCRDNEGMEQDNNDTIQDDIEEMFSWLLDTFNANNVEFDDDRQVPQNFNLSIQQDSGAAESWYITHIKPSASQVHTTRQFIVRP